MHACMHEMNVCAAQGCIYNSALASSDLDNLYACSADRKICQLEDDEATGTHIMASFDTGTVLTQLCLPPGKAVAPLALILPCGRRKA
jgi:hypothetical protein